ncbi:hypothetical protein ACVCL0_09165 [Rhodanobacter sp. UC4450_H17]
MTRGEQMELERRLVFPGAVAKLQCDQYVVALEVQRDKMRMVVMVYVDGHFKGKWMAEDCEERRRFLRPVIRRPKPYTPKQVKLLGKRWCDAQREKHTHTYYLPYWSSVRTLLRHLHKHNSAVELFEPAAA